HHVYAGEYSKRLNAKSLLLRNPVAVEKLVFSEESQNLGDRRCPGDSEKSFIELPDAKQFLRNRNERVFQQPPLFSTLIPMHVSLEGAFQA
ncbi:MAG: hypothetical protein WAK24_14005, partial [Candidatus Acidiferrales bacterium]